MLSRSASRSQPLPEKISLLLQEAKWLALGVLSLYIGLILLGYSKTDPGWSHAAEVARVSNPGGRFGAWLADLLFYLFGLSAWWWVIFLGYGLAWGFRRLRHAYQADRRSFFIVLAGFFVVLLSSSALESLRFHTHGAALPLAPGGLVGVELGAAVQRYLGFTGGTLMLLALLASGLSLFSGISWFTVIERVGLGLEQAWLAAQHAYYTWQDRRAGRELAQKREAVVETKRRKTVEAPPPQLRIEPAVVEVPKSERVQKERQQTLFADHAEGGLPPLALLDEPAGNGEPPSAESLAFTSRLIESKLGEFGVEVKVLAAYPGPVITRYEIEPATGVKGSQVVNLAKDLARALSLISIRVVETVPGKSCMALELPNPKRQTVRLSEIVGSKVFHDMHSPLTVVLGKDIGGLPVVADLAKMPHLLVAGTTGSGKSVGINAMILSLLYKSEPERVRLIMVDPKMLELSIYEGIPHLLAPVVTDMKHAANALNWCVVEMDKRYKLMAAVGVRNLAGFNKAVAEAAKAGAPLTNPFSITPESPEPIEQLPHIVVVVDELADLMMVAGKKIEELIARLAQKARAAGIHLILATQRPSVDVITGLIKANIPTRISFQVSSKIDSRTILDQMGAEALLGMGDMLYMPSGTGFPTRVHGAFVSDDEVHRVVAYLKEQFGEPDYLDGVLEGMGDGEGGGGDVFGDGDAGGEKDPLYDQAVAIVLQDRKASISYVQRKLKIGYNRAARLLEDMENAGLVSALTASGQRDILVAQRGD